MSGPLVWVNENGIESSATRRAVKSIQSRQQPEIDVAKVREALDQQMRDQLLLTGVTLMLKLKRRAELMPEDKPLDDRTAIQLLKLAAARPVLG